jgi:hypothetical protein
MFNSLIEPGDENILITEGGTVETPVLASIA